MVTLPPGAVRSVPLVNEVMTLKLLQVYGAKALVVTNAVEGLGCVKRLLPGLWYLAGYGWGVACTSRG